MTDYGSGYNDSDARMRAAAASSDASAAKRDVAMLEDDLARMRLVCAALWELVKEKNALAEEDLVAKIAELDARDGVADGKLERGVRKCVQCRRTVPARQNKCMYCGIIQPAAGVFESL